ncbi:MAG: ADP-ribosylation factor-like protein [Promethearchaeota archaeon]
MSQDQILCVSYFDQVIGPNLLYSNENLNEIAGTPDLGRILEFNDEEGTFIFAYRKFQTVNHIFYIDSQYARGGKELLMISYLVRSAIFKDQIVDVFKYLDSKSPILEDFAVELRKLNDLASLLHSKKNNTPEDSVLNIANKDFKMKFLEIFNKYFKRLSPNYQIETPITSKRIIKKVFIVGAPKTGRTTFLKNVELIQFLNIRTDDLPTRIYEVLVENLEILNFDENECEFYCKGYESFEKCMEHAQGFILIFNTSDKESLNETKRLFQIIDDKRLELGNRLVPILIIGNKFYNKAKLSPEYVQESFTIKDLKELGMRIRYFPINVLEEDARIMKALRWMIKNML